MAFRDGGLKLLVSSANRALKLPLQAPQFGLRRGRVGVRENALHGFCVLGKRPRDPVVFQPFGLDDGLRACVCWMVQGSLPVRSSGVGLRVSVGVRQISRVA